MSGLRMLRWLSLAIAVLAMFAPMAHVLEMPNKLALDGPLWLAVQQELYRGWGPVIGAPTEVAGMAAGIASLTLARRNADLGAVRRAAWAAAAYAGMLAAFFIFNARVNRAVAGWTAASMPPDWPAYRVRWEAGHAIAAAFAVVAFLAIMGDCLAAARRPLP